MNVDFVPFILVVRVLCKPRLIFSRINGPNVSIQMRTFHFLFLGQYPAISTVLGIGSENVGHKERCKRNNVPKLEKQ